ncbi:hypothetical protein B6U91_01890 [Candidatus Pacearchaeota archaeon ex4484_71]|nr:MAG: hypothetical protein B6U91_01890 [Candidatus Pacearchaeota archaeon ex4484_71]
MEENLESYANLEENLKEYGKDLADLPQEDSYLLSEVLKRKLQDKEISCLEIGAGSGIQLEVLESIGIKKILGCDINRNAVAECKKKGFECLYSDLFSNVKGKFDIIVFNPPYLPEEETEDMGSKLSTTGGKKGSEIINRFLQQAEGHLKEGGEIILLTSSLTQDVDWRDWERKKLAEKKLFFEKLFVWELRKKNSC